MADESTTTPDPSSFLDTLSSPAPESCHAETIDFTAAGLPAYSPAFALLIHDLFSPSECASLLSAAQSSANNQWLSAMVNVGGGRQKLMTEIRLCDRILWDEPALAEKLMARIMPHLPANIVTLKNSAHITGNGPVKREETWRISRLNERLRFLRYTSGMYFREHCDGSYVTSDGQEVSHLTIHIYLNGAEHKDGELPLTGGATTFFNHAMTNWYDVKPETGSCLVFQHRGLIHSGEEVITGTKYTVRTDVMYRKVDPEA